MSEGRELTCHYTGQLFSSSTPPAEGGGGGGVGFGTLRADLADSTVIRFHLIVYAYDMEVTAAALARVIGAMVSCDSERYYIEVLSSPWQRAVASSLTMSEYNSGHMPGRALQTICTMKTIGNRDPPIHESLAPLICGSSDPQCYDLCYCS